MPHGNDRRIASAIPPEREDSKDKAFFGILENEKLSTAFLCVTRKCPYLCPAINKERKTVMARPIKETPILFGNDARRFEERMKQKRTVPKEEIERVREHYRIAMSIFKKGKDD